MRKNRGFTLIELMVTVAIVAILAGLAAPGMRGFIESSQIRAETQRVAGLLSLARSQAIADNQAMIFHEVLTAGVLNVDVYSDGDGDATLDYEAGVDTYIERSSGEETGLDYGMTDAFIQFQQDGLLDPADRPGASITICNDANTSGRLIAVNTIGRVSVSELDDPGADCL